MVPRNYSERQRLKLSMFSIGYEERFLWPLGRRLEASAGTSLLNVGDFAGCESGPLHGNTLGALKKSGPATGPSALIKKQRQSPQGLCRRQIIPTYCTVKFTVVDDVIAGLFADVA